MKNLFAWIKESQIRKYSIISVFALVIAFAFLGGSDEVSTDAVNDKVYAVKVATPAELSGGDSLSLIGNVRSVSEVALSAERGGKVTRVNAKLGDEVRAGQVIVELENASERAALLQAEGAYEAARANAASSQISTSEAELRLAEAVKSLSTASNNAFGLAQDMTLNFFESFFANSNTSYPTLRLNSTNAASLRSDRVAIGASLPKWQSLNFLSLSQAERNIESEFIKLEISRLLRMVDQLIADTNLDSNKTNLGSAEAASLNARLITKRSEIVATLSAFEGARLSYNSAEEGLKRAEIGSTGSTVSASDAQLKQALGGLRAAQANFEKTLLRTPIGGTINQLDIKLGDLLGAGQSVVRIANNGQLEVVTYVSELERNLLNVEDEVLVNNNYAGEVVTIAPAISADTGKIEVRITLDTADLLNGEAVRITKVIKNNDTSTDVTIPLSAVRFNGDQASVFVINDDVLESIPVTVGEIRGSYVKVTEGLSLEREIIIDARGRKAGDEVEVIRD